MSIVETFEYYSTCPQCGAANVGAEKCDYCGASLIKARTNTQLNTGNAYYSDRNEKEEKYFEEDANYPEIKGKIFEKDEFLFIFCPIFGGIFLVVPTIIFIAFSGAGIMEPWIIPMLGLFWLIGIGGIYPLINYFVSRLKCKNGREIIGVVRGYQEAMYTINGSPALNVRILVDQYTEPKILVLSTGSNRRLYPLGKELKLKGYKNKFIIEEAKLQ